MEKGVGSNSSHVEVLQGKEEARDEDNELEPKGEQARGEVDVLESKLRFKVELRIHLAKNGFD